MLCTIIGIILFSFEESISFLSIGKKYLQACGLVSFSLSLFLSLSLSLFLSFSLSVCLGILELTIIKGEERKESELEKEKEEEM